MTVVVRVQWSNRKIRANPHQTFHIFSSHRVRQMQNKKQTLRAISPQTFHVVISNKQTKNPVKLFTSFALIARKQMQTNTVRINTNTDHFLCRPLIHICNTYIYIKYIMYYISCIKTSQCKKANKHSVPAP